MKIIGIGTDMVAIARIQKIWDQYGMAFAHRILTRGELENLQKNRNPVSFLAKRYAAKEAVAKALGTGFRPEGVLLTDIGVSNDALGRPFLKLSGGAANEMSRKQVIDSHISLSDEKEYALAFVVLVGAD